MEQWLEKEREQIPLWVPVGLGIGIATWFALPHRWAWLAFCCVTLALASAAVLLPTGGRARRMAVSAGILACLGCLLIWGKSALVGEPPLQRATFAVLTGEVRSVSPVPSKDMVRLLLRPVGAPELPSLVRVNVREADMSPAIDRGATVRFRVRLMPPAPPSLPGGYDFAARAYFQGIGATGRALPPIAVIAPATGGPDMRNRLFSHILDRLEGPAEGIAAALATGDQGAIAEDDAEAMRRSGLAHLLSISGLHVTALIGAVIFLLMRTMAISRRAALNWPLMLIAATGGALAGIGYTLLTGAEVPTVRSCIAALLVLGGLALGRDAITLRLVATGALIVLCLWPEALVGPSFQMSFGAVIAIIALSEHPRFRAFAAARDENGWRKFGRSVAVLLMTGFAVELMLAPIAFFHFHKAGMLGAFANIIAIPLTTFVVMPLEALALLLDLLGLGAPAWWATGKALDFLLLIAHGVGGSPMAVALGPALPNWVFAVMVMGGLWCLLWRSAWRWLGLAPVGIGLLAILLNPPPDILITGDGRHVALRTEGDGMALLRDRAGEYVRDALTESAGYDGTLESLASLPQARCSADLCSVLLDRGGRSWRLLVTRSRMFVERKAFMRDCQWADIVVSDRRLPRWCRPRWLKVDRSMLAATGGLAINLENGTIRSVHSPHDAHPWMPRRGRTDQSRSR
ncbi:competence protein ComEC [Sphingobium baderi]|uniref:Competence protein ComEC n=1 Tax=Sphingobium baderi TaxID=1332080 RepID=A0A0S3F202_9SPHN|nr:ComEC/Rec2 family competence protein [Sphingobium baderi]ALR21691.1 competence protein ComEC [Sphingobium baderi]